MKVFYVWEHNGNDSLLYADNYIGAFTRGASLDEALGKFNDEITSYCKWRGIEVPNSVQTSCALDKPSSLNINDADSDVIFESEKTPISKEEYIQLRDLALKSAEDFLHLYNSIPNKQVSCIPERKTFYGQIPRTAEEMYVHTKNVNEYYFGEIGVDVDNSGDIFECRKRGFDLLEQRIDFLKNSVIDGSYGEEWSLRKLLRRFIWHDRIHAKAMYKMAIRTFPSETISNIFCF